MRRFISLLVCLFAFLAGGCATIHASRRSHAAGRMVDQLVKIDSVQTLNDAAMRHVELAGNPPPRIVLYDPVNSEYPRIGIWISAEKKTEFPFTQMIPSWNADCPPDTGVRFWVRVRQARSWSPWLYVGYWGSPSPANGVTKFPGGRVDIDTLKLSRPANAWQIRALLESFETDVKINPSIRRISVTYSGRVSDPELLEKLSRPTTQPSTIPAVIDLPVPYRAQGDAPNSMTPQVCSPTSVTMVLAYWGKNYSIAANCQAIYDRDYHLFGNWDRAVARAGAVGLDAWVTHFRNWRQVRATLATGQPIIASIQFKKGEFPSSILKESSGHLIVIRGMTARGDLICNDPGKRGVGDHVIYKAADMQRAWLNHGGVAYIIHGAHPINLKTER